MKTDPHPGDICGITGNVIRVGRDHQIAIYRRDGASWVAEFRHGVGRVTDATAWFGAGARTVSACHRWRASTLDSAQALTPEFIERIEQLHRPAKHRSAECGNASSHAIGSVNRWRGRLAAFVEARLPAAPEAASERRPTAAARNPRAHLR